MAKRWCNQCQQYYTGRECNHGDDRDTFTKRAEHRHTWGMNEEDSNTWMKPQRCSKCKQLMEFIERRGITYAICRKCGLTI